MRLPSKKDRKNAEEYKGRIEDLASELWGIAQMVPDENMVDATENAFKRFRGEAAQDLSDFMPDWDNAPGIDEEWMDDDDQI